MFTVDWMGLAMPFAYLLVLSGALMTFSRIYRKRKASTLSPVHYIARAGCALQIIPSQMLTQPSTKQSRAQT